MRDIAFAVVIGCIVAGCSETGISASTGRDTAARAPAASISEPVTYAGREVRGKASYYSQKFDGRTMANGKPFDAHGNNAASKVLPLGTVAKVTNTENGKTATVRIEDRGPHVRGRIVDVSPKVATQLGMKHQGTAPVLVKPIAGPGQSETAEK